MTWTPDTLGATSDLIELVEASEKLYAYLVKLLGPTRVDPMLCECDDAGVCAWHAWVDELDDVQGKRSRREGL